MGWTALHRQRGISTKEFYQKELWANGKYKIILASQPNPSEAYLAVRRPDGAVFAMVCAQEWRRGYINFVYKVGDEGMGPAWYNCPRKILEALSPVKELYPIETWAFKHAALWRVRCWQRIRKWESLTLGTQLLFDPPLRLRGGGELCQATITSLRPLVVRSNAGPLVRLTKQLATEATILRKERHHETLRTLP